MRADRGKIARGDLETLQGIDIGVITLEGEADEVPYAERDRIAHDKRKEERRNRGSYGAAFNPVEEGSDDAFN